MTARSALYDATRTRIAALTDASADQLAAVVPACPRWTVADLFGHLVYGPLDLCSGNYPGDDFEGWTQAQVEQGRGQAPDALMATWAGAAPQIAGLLDANPAMSPTLFDAIVHEQDLRAALGLVARSDEEAQAFVLDALLTRALPGTLTGAPTLRIVVDGRSTTIGDGEPVATMEAPSAFELVRAGFGRRSLDQVQGWAWDGDPTPFLGHLSLFTPRADALVEPADPS